MKTSILLLFTLLATAMTTHSVAQETTGRKYVKFIVNDVRTFDEAKEIDLFIRNQNGVYMSRMDKPTSVYFAIFDGGQHSVSDFKQWITDLGYTPNCVVFGPYGDGSYTLPLSKKLCEQQSELHAPNEDK